MSTEEYGLRLHELDLAGIAFDVELHTESDDFRDGISVDDMVAQLMHAVRPEVRLDRELLRRYLERFFELMTVEGSGLGFAGSAGFIQAATVAISSLERAGIDTADLWLVLASYHGMLLDGRSARLQCIRRALRASARHQGQRVRGLLALAEYRTDQSQDWLARRALRCTQMRHGNAATDDLRALALARLGITHFYGDATRAEKLFAAAIDAANRAPATSESYRALALAHHYLGRIMSERRGNHARGVELLVRGQRFKERVAPEQMQLGYYNLRLGETLLAAGNMVNAWHHFARSSELFQQTNARVGLAHLYAAQARVFKRVGNLARAEEELQNSVRIASEARNPRLSLLFMVQLALLQAARGKRAAALVSLARSAVPLLANGGASVRLVVSYLRTRAVPKTVGGEQADVVACPCPEHERGWTHRDIALAPDVH